MSMKSLKNIFWPLQTLNLPKSEYYIQHSLETQWNVIAISQETYKKLPKAANKSM